MSRHRVVLLLATLAFYLAIVWAVVTTSWLVRFDWEVMFFRPYQQWPQVHAFLDYYEATSGHVITKRVALI